MSIYQIHLKVEGKKRCVFLSKMEAGITVMILHVLPPPHLSISDSQMVLGAGE